jgi:hypothetical protein
VSSTINLSCFLMCCVSDLSRAFFLFSSFPFSFECVLRLNFNFDGFRAKKDFLLPSTTARCPPTTKQLEPGTWRIRFLSSLHFTSRTSLHFTSLHFTPKNHILYQSKQLTNQLFTCWYLKYTLHNIQNNVINIKDLHQNLFRNPAHCTICKCICSHSHSCNRLHNRKTHFSFY